MEKRTWTRLLCIMIQVQWPPWNEIILLMQEDLISPANSAQQLHTVQLRLMNCDTQLQLLSVITLTNAELASGMCSFNRSRVFPTKSSQCQHNYSVWKRLFDTLHNRWFIQLPMVTLEFEVHQSLLLDACRFHLGMDCGLLLNRLKSSHTRLLRSFFNSVKIQMPSNSIPTQPMKFKIDTIFFRLSCLDPSSSHNVIILFPNLTSRSYDLGT